MRIRFVHPQQNELAYASSIMLLAHAQLLQLLPPIAQGRKTRSPISVTAATGMPVMERSNAPITGWKLETSMTLCWRTYGFMPGKQ